MILKSISIRCDEEQYHTITFTSDSKIHVITGNGIEHFPKMIRWNLGEPEVAQPCFTHGKFAVTTEWINSKNDECNNLIITRSTDDIEDRSTNVLPRLRIIGLEDLSFEITNTEKVLSEEMLKSYSEIFHVFSDGSANVVKQEDGYHLQSFTFPRKTPRPISELSGGEKIQYGLSLLLASSVDEADILVLDECDAPLDSNSHQKLLEVLEMLREKFEQIFVVSNSRHFDGCDDYPVHELFI